MATATSPDAVRDKVETPAETGKVTNPELSLVALAGKGPNPFGQGEQAKDAAPMKGAENKQVLDLGANDIYAPTDKSREVAAKPEAAYEESRKRLLGLVGDQMSGPSQLRDNVKGPYKETFEKDMQTFEERVKKGEVTPEEANKTYKAIGDLLSSDSKVTTPLQRQQLAKNLMYHTAHPNLTDQGEYNTCASTAISERLFQRTPSVAVDMVNQAATTGKYISTDGKEIKIDPNSLRADKHTMAGRPLDLDRSYSTQVLNNVISNDAMQRGDKPHFYKQNYMGDDMRRKMMSDDNGERALQADGKEARMGGRPIRTPMMALADIEKSLQRYTGEKGLTFASSEAANGDKQGGLLSNKDRADLTEFGSVKQMREKLETMQKDGRLPLVATVFADHKALVKGLPPAIGGGAHEQGHVVSIKGYDAQTGNVTISNQWGKASDRTLTAQEFFEASMPRFARHSRRR